MATPFAPVLIAPLLAFSLYRRVRRSIGPQPVRRGSLKFRCGLLGLIGVLALGHAASAPPALLAGLGGLAIGAALAAFGLHATQFAGAGARKTYTPHLGLGLAVSALFLLRIAFRFEDLMTPPAMPAPPTPLTLGLLETVLAFYAVYYAGVLWRTRVVVRPAL